MTDSYGDRISRLFRERAEISREFDIAQKAAGALTLEHNKLVDEANQAVTDGSRQRAQMKANRKGEEAQKARARANDLSQALYQKEIEIADMIGLLWAASKSLLSGDGGSRQVQVDLAAIRERLSAAGFAADGNTAALARMQRELSDLSRSLKQISDAVARSVPVRQLGWREMPEPSASGLSDEVMFALPEKVAVLLFASEYPGSDSLEIGREIREIQLRIQAARFRDRITLIPWTAAQPLDLLPNVNMHNPHMVQFSGHGTPDGILMTGPASRPQPLAADRLIQMLRWSGEDLRIVFFNICDSEEHARAAAQIVDGAVGMRGEMHDTGARTFAASLYSGLAFGRSLKHAFYQACAAIGDEPDSSVPQLFFRDGTDPHEIVLVRPGHDDR